MKAKVGSHEEKLRQVREVRDAIAAEVTAFCAEKAGACELSA
jgi:hypothetical protein